MTEWNTDKQADLASLKKVSEYWRKRYEETFDTVTKLEDKRKFDSELLNTTLCNLSRANQELGKLRGTDELTAHKMRAHITKLEEEVIELHIKNATPNAAKYKRDTRIAQSVRLTLQTAFRWAGAALIIGLICTLTLLTVKYGL